MKTGPYSPPKIVYCNQSLLYANATRIALHAQDMAFCANVLVPDTTVQYTCTTQNDIPIRPYYLCLAKVRLCLSCE